MSIIDDDDGTLGGGKDVALQSMKKNAQDDAFRRYR